MGFLDENKIPKGITFTPIFDHLVNQLGVTKSSILGVIWRYSQMKERLCRASQESISKRLGLSRQTVNKHLSELINEGYIVDLSPNLKNRPHLFKLTEKIFEKGVQNQMEGEKLFDSKVPDNFTSLSIFEMFGVNNLYLKKELINKEINNKDVEVEKREDISFRNLSNNNLVELLNYKPPFDLNAKNPFGIINNKNNKYTRLLNLILFGFFWNIATFEWDVIESFEEQIPHTIFFLTKKGEELIIDKFNQNLDEVNEDKLAEVIDFWFYFCLEGHERIENIEQMLLLYEDDELLKLETKYPEVYRKSREIRVVKMATGFYPPEILFPRIFKSFDIPNPLHELRILRELYTDWIAKGYKRDNFGWFFDWYLDKEN